MVLRLSKMAEVKAVAVVRAREVNLLNKEREKEGTVA